MSHLGQANLEGRSVGTLTVGNRAGDNRWHTVCSRCKAAGTEAHAALVNGRAQCKASGCRDNAEAVRAAAAETLPKARRQAVTDENAEQQAAADAAEAERAAIEAQWQDGHTQIAKLIRERIVSQRDDEVFIDPTTIGVKMTQAEADAYNAAEAAKFAVSNPSFYPSRANRESLGRYFDLNGLAIVSSATLAVAVRRLSEYGLLESRPAPAPIALPSQPAYVNLAVASDEPAAAEPDGMQGFDPDTGAERWYTDREIALMSADQMKRAFKITRAAQTLNRRW